MYAGDYDEHFPDRDVWMNVVKPYLRGEAFYHCPKLKEEYGADVYGYCFNAKLSGAKVPAMDRESQPLVFDSVNLARNASGSFDSLPEPGRHGGKNGIGYADGHARYQLWEVKR